MPAGLMLVANPFLTWGTETAGARRSGPPDPDGKGSQSHRVNLCIWIVVGMCGLQSITNGQYEATWIQDPSKAQSMMFVSCHRP